VALQNTPPVQCLTILRLTTTKRDSALPRQHMTIPCCTYTEHNINPPCQYFEALYSAELHRCLQRETWLCRCFIARYSTLPLRYYRVPHLTITLLQPTIPDRTIAPCHLRVRYLCSTLWYKTLPSLDVTMPLRHVTLHYFAFNYHAKQGFAFTWPHYAIFHRYKVRRRFAPPYRYLAMLKLDLTVTLRYITSPLPR